MPVVTGVEVGLLISILDTYGFKATKKKALEILKTSGKSAFSSTLISV